MIKWKDRKLWRYVKGVEIKRPSRGSLRHVLHFLEMAHAANPRRFAWAITLRVVAATVPLGIFKIAGVIVDSISRGGSTYTVFGLLAMEASLATLLVGLDRIGQVNEVALSEQVNRLIDTELIRKTAVIELKELELPDTSDRMQRARDSTFVRASMLQVAFGTAQQVLAGIILFAALSSVNGWLILCLLLPVGPLVFAELKNVREGNTLRTTVTSARRESEYARMLGTTSAYAKEVKQYSAQSFLAAKYLDAARRVYDLNVAYLRRRAIRTAKSNVFAELSFYVGYGLLALSAIGRQISIGELTFAIATLRRFREAINSLIQASSSIVQNGAMLDDLFMYLETPEFEPPDSKLALALSDSRLVIRDVWFRYRDDDPWVLQNVNLEIAVGQRVVLSGVNGSGKTTLLKLIAGLYTPTSGSVSFDGQSISGLSSYQRSQICAVLFQDFIRYDYSVCDNIDVGKTHDIETRSVAIHASTADEVIRNLAGGEAQMLGTRFTRGIELSGGSWQSIALARALVRNVPVVLLDEPCTAMDQGKESIAWAGIRDSCAASQICICASHSSKSRVFATRVVTLAGGFVVSDAIVSDSKSEHLHQAFV